MGAIEVNGAKYEYIPRTKSKAPSSMVAMLSLFSAVSMYGENNYERKRPSVNIVDEFRLIQQKKSKLSKNDRDWVEMMFFKNFKEVK